MGSAIYRKIKAQITRSTGTYSITCPVCNKDAKARVSRPDRIHARMVRTTCRHCGNSISFYWRSQVWERQNLEEQDE